MRSLRLPPPCLVALCWLALTALAQGQTPEASPPEKPEKPAERDRPPKKLKEAKPAEDSPPAPGVPGAEAETSPGEEGATTGDKDAAAGGEDAATGEEGAATGEQGAAAADEGQGAADAPDPDLDQPAYPPMPAMPTTICQGRRIRKIGVRGHGRVAAEDIRATIRLRKGLPCTDAEVTRDVRALWDLGYFADIAVEAKVVGKKVDLMFRVRERPAVGAVVFDGNDELDDSDLEEELTLEEGSILSVPDVRRHVEKLKKLYAEEGFFLADVEYELLPRPNNEVEVRFVISEGEEVTVRRIRFLGNKAISASDLKGVMQTGETNLFSFITSSNNFQRANFEEDLNRIRALYYDQGYLTVHLGEPLVELTPDRHHIDITISVKEGPRFKVKSVSVTEVDAEGQEVEPLAGRRNLREQIRLDPGDWFSRSVIANDLQEITRFYRDRGYAKVQVNPQTDLDIDARLVDLVVSIQRGPLCYIQRINIKGNSTTRDEVIRRETRIAEGELYNQTRVERSKERITALGYFESVEVSEEAGATNNRIVVNFEVVEKPTGTFQIGAGFSSLETFLFTGQIQHQNLFGRGQTIGLNLQLSGIRQLVQVRFVEPYLYGTEWSMAIEGFKILRQLRDYNRDSLGGSLTFGHPILHEDLRLFLTYRIEDIEITPATGGALSSAGLQYNVDRTIPLRNLFRSGLTSSLRLSLQWDSRNNRLFPSKGVLATVSTEMSDKILASDNNFLRHRANFRYYHPLFWGIVAKLNTEWGLITSPDAQGVPVFERYFLGGILDLRGFPLQSVGPRIALPSSLNPSAVASNRGTGIGGNMQLYYNFEIEFPIVESVGIKGVLFTDGGNSWNLEDALCSEGLVPSAGDPATDPCGVHPLRLRTSLGFGFRWFSPLGPLRFEWGYPFHPRRPYEDTVEFQFTVGNAF